MDRPRKIVVPYIGVVDMGERQHQLAVGVGVACVGVTLALVLPALALAYLHPRVPPPIKLPRTCPAEAPAPKAHEAERAAQSSSAAQAVEHSPAPPVPLVKVEAAQESVEVEPEVMETQKDPEPDPVEDTAEADAPRGGGAGLLLDGGDEAAAQEVALSSPSYDSREYAGLTLTADLTPRATGPARGQTAASGGEGAEETTGAAGGEGVHLGAGYDTSGDGKVDSLDTTGDGRIDSLIVPLLPDPSLARDSSDGGGGDLDDVILRDLTQHSKSEQELRARLTKLKEQVQVEISSEEVRSCVPPELEAILGAETAENQGHLRFMSEQGAAQVIKFATSEPSAEAKEYLTVLASMTGMHQIADFFLACFLFHRADDANYKMMVAKQTKDVKVLAVETKKRKASARDATHLLGIRIGLGPWESETQRKLRHLASRLYEQATLGGGLQDENEESESEEEDLPTPLPHALDGSFVLVPPSSNDFE